MNARERVLKAINHEEPDRVPLFNQDSMPGFRKNLYEYWGGKFKKESKYRLYYRNFNVEKKLGFDCAWGAGGLPVNPPSDVMKDNPLPKLDDPNHYVDFDGRIHEKPAITTSDIGWYLTNYITTEEMADHFYDTYYGVEWEVVPGYAEKTNRRLKRFPTDEFVPCAHLFPILEPLWEGIGLGLLVKLIRKNKAKLKKYIDLRTKVGVQWAKAVAETDFDVVFLCDDTAFKNRTMINPKHHRDLIVPAYKKMVHEIRKAGKFAIFHSDGFTEPYFDGLIEAGFHGVESLEPFAGMDLKHLKEKYGDKLCLVGNIDVSGVLPFGTNEEVIEAVKKCIKDAGEGSGYMLSPCTDLTNSCKVENVITMIAAAKKYGQYPLNL